MKDVKASHQSPGLSPKSRLFNAVMQGEGVRQGCKNPPQQCQGGMDGGEVGRRQDGAEGWVDRWREEGKEK